MKSPDECSFGYYKENRNCKNCSKRDSCNVKNKLSVELMNQAKLEENDFRFMRLVNKSIREKRLEKFTETRLNQIKDKYPTEYRANGSYTIKTEKYGVIDYFPKANKMLFRNTGKWKKPALKWIIEQLLN